MGIEYVLDIRHHRGLNDRHCPRIRCDGCGQFIEAANGNVWWSWRDESKAVEGVAPLFIHKRCPDGQHREPVPDEDWLSEELDYFLVYLVENASLNYAQARKNAMELAKWEF